MTREAIVRLAVLLALSSACAFAQTVGGSDPFTQLFKNLAAIAVGIVTAIAVLVLLWKLLETGHRGGAAMVGIFAALVLIYCVTHVQRIVDWIASLA
jgi:uncharacterized membrane protein